MFLFVCIIVVCPLSLIPVLLFKLRDNISIKETLKYVCWNNLYNPNANNSGSIYSLVKCCLLSLRIIHEINSNLTVWDQHMNVVKVFNFLLLISSEVSIISDAVFPSDYTMSETGKQDMGGAFQTLLVCI